MIIKEGSISYSNKDYEISSKFTSEYIFQIINHI